MILGGVGKILGLAVGETALTVVEVRVSAGKRQWTHRGTFGLPAGAGFDRPAELGAALAQFLKTAGFTARHVVVGLPGKWLLVKPKLLPPAAAAAAAGMLRLQAEHDFTADGKDWVFDYAGHADAANKWRALLVATPRQRVDQLAAVLKAAKLQPLAVTSATLVLAGAIGTPGAPGAPAARDEGRAGLYLGLDGAELALAVDGQVSMMHHLPVPTAAASGGAAGATSTSKPAGTSPGAPSTTPPGTIPGPTPGIAPAITSGPTLAAASGNGNGTPLAALGSQVRRLMSLAPAEQVASAPRELVVWDDLGVGKHGLSALHERMGLPVIAGPALAEPAGPMPAATEDGAPFAAATALALAGFEAARRPVDFLHSRLAPPQRSLLQHPLRWVAVVTVVALAGVGVWVWDLQARQSAVSDLQADLDARKTELEAARANVQRVTFARGWYDTRPAFLGCLRALSQLLPDTTPMWMTNVDLKDDMTGRISGKALDERVVSAFTDRLKANKSFSNVKPRGTRLTDQRRREWTFDIEFTYLGKE